MRPAQLRMAVALREPHLAALHGMRRLQELEQQLQAVLSAGNKAQQHAKQATKPAMSSPTVAAAKSPAVPPVPPGLAAPQPPVRQLLQRAQEGTAELPTANPAAALLAATRGSPDSSASRAKASLAASLSPAAVASGQQQPTREQLVSVAARVGEAAGAVAAALCELRDPAAIHGLQSYCRKAFLPLLQRLEQPPQTAAGAPAAATLPVDPTVVAAATVAAVSAWEWLSAVELHAAGRYEQAVRLYVSYSSASTAAGGSGGDSTPPKPFLPASTLWALTAEAFAALGNAAGIVSWQQQQLARARLPPPATARYLDLASWEPAPVADGKVQEAHQSTLLDALRLRAIGGGDSVGRAAAVLAEVALAGGPERTAGLPVELLLPTAALEVPLRPFTAWQWISKPAVATATQLLPLGLLLKACSCNGDGQRDHGNAKLSLLVAAAAAAADGDNAMCSGRLLADAHAEAGSDPAAALCVRLAGLALAPTEARAGQLGAAWALLRDAQSSCAALVPAAATCLARALGKDAGGTPGVAGDEVLALLRSASLPACDLGAWEAALVQQEPVQVLEYAAFKAAAAAAPDSAHQWWALAHWLHGRGEPAACSAAFDASCRALALASAAGAAQGDSATLPLLLQLLGLLQAGLPAEQLAAGLDLVPATAWLPIVPQLLAALARGQTAVRPALRALSRAAPWAVLLPGQVELESAGEGSEGGQEGQAGGAHPHAALAELVQEVRAERPELARQLHTFCREMVRLAVLPEEHWHGVLQEAAAVMAKRLATLPVDASAPAGAGELAAAALAPVLLALQQHLFAASGSGNDDAGAPPHQHGFAQKTLPHLRRLLVQVQQEALKSGGGAGGGSSAGGDASAARDLAGWQRVVSLLKRGAAELGNALAQRQLDMPEIAPALASWSCSDVPVPGALPAGASAAAVAAAAGGASASADALVTVVGVEPGVSVLPTKTRPKKLVLLGSDGRSYTFLLKASCCPHVPCLQNLATWSDAPWVAPRAHTPSHSGPTSRRVAKTCEPTSGSCRCCLPPTLLCVRTAAQLPLLLSARPPATASWRSTALQSRLWDPVSV